MSEENNQRYYEHQDLKPIVFNKKLPPKEKVVKPKGLGQPTFIVKEDEEGEIIRNDKFNPAFVKEVIQKRVDKKMKRKDLAIKLGIPENELGWFEQNKMVYKGPLVDKIKRVLGKDFENKPKL